MPIIIFPLTESLQILKDLLYSFLGFIIYLLDGAYFLITNVFIGGFIHFIFNLTGYVSLVFIIIQIFIIGLSIMKSQDEYGKKNPINLMTNYFSYNWFIFIGIFKVFAFFLKQAYTFITSLKLW